MNGHRRFDVIEHLSDEGLNIAINEAQKAGEARAVAKQLLAPLRHPFVFG